MYTTYWKWGLKNDGVLYITSKLLNSKCLRNIYFSFIHSCITQDKSISKMHESYLKMSHRTWLTDVLSKDVL